MNFKLAKGNIYNNQVIEELIKYNNNNNNNNNKKESKLFRDRGYICKG